MLHKKKYVGVRVPKELKNRIKTLAAKKGISMIRLLEEKTADYEAQAKRIT